MIAHGRMIAVLFGSVAAGHFGHGLVAIPVDGRKKTPLAVCRRFISHRISPINDSKTSAREEVGADGTSSGCSSADDSVIPS
ncbi:MAG TPA: hypothetical protein VJT49_11240 [Amycolatopsis sp.]|uniref:hypothetical protein n=1 Tax=Amycolatopsis sp. TaxID=37632 RepID=UPI002B47B24A|nr:hypothetical protein [Amycolatopsis sp.]HKS45664.1 hypothetical protein [Amycolatopsis sp.]